MDDFKNLAEELKNNFEAINQADVETLSTILPAEPLIPELLSQLEIIARRTGVDLLGVDLREEDLTALAARTSQATAGAPRVKDTARVLIDLNFDPFTYERFVNFITALETHSRLFDVEGIEFKGGGEESLKLRTYFLDSK